jgi:2,5-dihydroxypyridine 5,6-dioxygenase
LYFSKYLLNGGNNMYRYQYELSKASMILVRDIFKLKIGETFIVLADTGSDPRVVDATAGAAFAVGAKPMVIWLASPLGVGKSADPMLPVKALTAVLKEADASVHFNFQSLLYTTPLVTAMRENKKLRHLVATGMNTKMMVRMIGRVDFLKLKEFMGKIVEMTKNAKHVRITTPSGGDIEFNNVKTKDGKPDPNYPIGGDYGDASFPGWHMLPGQIGWTPDLKSINGTIVFDGSLQPPCGLLDESVHLTIESGKIIKIEGGKQAAQFENWLKSYNHPQMLIMAHATYGFNPGAVLSGDIDEDERVWGCTEWGIGRIGPMLIKPNGIDAPSHTDGICLNSSVWLDGKLIMDKGRQVIPELKKLEEDLLAPFGNTLG